MKVSIKMKSYQKKDGKQIGKLFLRIRNNNQDLLFKTGIQVMPQYWDGDILGYRPSIPENVISHKEAKLLNERLQQLILCIEQNCDEDSSRDVIERTIELFMTSVQNNDEIENTKTKRTKVILDKVAKRMGKPTKKHFTVIDYFKRYLAENDFNSWHNQALTSVMHKLERYEAWQGFLAEVEDFHLYLEDFTFEELERYHEYLSHESEYRDTYPDFYAQFKLFKPIDIRPLSKNSISAGIQRLNMFLNWCVKEGLLKDLSFRRFKCDGQVYGVPYYLTIEERDFLMDFDLSDFPRLELHRDKFVFQCLIGCRCDDLDRMTWDNINDDFIEFIPHKNLLNDRAEVVRMPLTDKMRIILERQDPTIPNFFFPYCQEIYRLDIKEVLRKAGINRMVTILDAQTRKGIQRPICDVAASHLARRTFIANLYNKVQDPNLISSLTGHVEDSKAFARYRAINDSTKRNLINLID